MAKKIVRLFPYYYQLVLTLLMTSCLGSLIFLWSNGYLDGSHTSSVYEATQIIRTLKEDKTVGYIHQSVSEGDISRARSRFNYFEDRIKKVNKIVNVSGYEELEQSFARVRQSFSKLQSISNAQDAHRVLQSKVKQFESLAIKNKWRTLTNMSSRILTRLGTSASDLSGLNGKLKNIKSDIESMTKITSGSVLAQIDKNEIFASLEGLNVEITILENFSSQRNTFNRAFQSFTKNFETWQSALNPELSLQKIEADRYGHYFLYLLVSLLFMCAGLLMIGYIYQKKYEEDFNNKLEEKLLEVNERSFVGASKLNEDYSYEFKKKFMNLRTYVHKKMMFGSIFQDTLPFPSVLLNKNLKVTWANQYFQEMWSLDNNEIKEEKVSWDFLAQSTNLGENDPVIEALRNNIAGIYQIQIKSPIQKSFESFEMYVSPIEYNGETSIQIYLYSLASVQDTIESQGRSIVGPITRTLDALLTNKFDGELREQIRSDYEVANISDIYERIQKYYDYITIQREGLLDEIDRLEDEVSDLRKIISDISGLNAGVAQNNLHLVKDLTVVKNKIIEMATLADEYRSLNVEIKTSYGENLENYKDSLDKNHKLYSSFKGALGNIPSVEKFKDEVKVLKSEMMSLKSKVSSSINKLIDACTIDMNSELKFKQSQTVDRINNELGLLGDMLMTLEKKMVFLDVQFSKSEMVFSEYRKVIDENKLAGSEKFLEEKVLEQFKDQNKKLFELQERAEKTETQVVAKLKSVYEGYKNNAKAAYTVKQLVDEKIESSAAELRRSPEAEV